ncbi:beta-ketoacyl-ACP synthase III [Candidatus Thiosymbion oneisti]|uniref:beta-ketoacyl-ACP synthase III n=1 Tax=Candidatus Thiosymbion oneisti TaxID=589554 RepID=UPI000B06EA36|nr:beta-ketoacyl-ACP synthase III [Candidatus Thiosymbion oneisti]
MSLYARIAGIGSFLPERVLTNQDLEAIVDTSDEWIRERTGIRKRHLVTQGERCSRLAEVASRRALEDAGIDPATLDLIIVATTTPDQVFPSAACFLQQRLGIRGCCAFDLVAGCTGFVYALGVVDQFIRTGGIRRALVVGAEILSYIVDWQDRDTAVLFGDGAGAVVVEAGPEPGILSSHLHAEGAYTDILQVPGGVGDRERDSYIEMRGNELFKIAVTTLSDVVEETLRANGMQKSELDWLVPHQANFRILQAVARRLKLPLDRVVVTVGEHANTSSASIPLAFDVAVRDGRIRRGQTVLMEAFGGGITWGSVLLVY